MILHFGFNFVPLTNGIKPTTTKQNYSLMQCLSNIFIGNCDNDVDSPTRRVRYPVWVRVVKARLRSRFDHAMRFMQDLNR